MINLIRKRRSIRSYTGEPIDQETVELLVESLLRSPSSRNINPWEFVVVDDRELLTQLSTSKQHGSSFLKDAALGVVICADSTKTDVWVEDCSIAAILLQMTAQSLGLGSCWIQIRNRQQNREKSSEQFIQELLGLPEQMKVNCIVSIGHPAENRRPLAASQLQYDKVNHNRYQACWQK
ncbi:MAG TPA: nitroreductase family protein [Geomonas sp.]|nr:nitroreductase family protein [Geomonas sp.]